MKRREFARYTALGTSALLIPQFLKGFEKITSPFLGPLESAYGESGNKKILVVVQFSGGNDGLNTVIPYRNDIYYKARPVIGKKPNEVLRLNDELGLNQGMSALKALYDDGKLAVVNNVGYPNPDRSHFRSMDIWETASESNQILNTGWIGRYLDTNCEGAQKPYSAMQIDNVLNLAMKGENINALAYLPPNPDFGLGANKYISAISNANDSELLKSKANLINGDNLHYLYKTLAEYSSSVEYISKTSNVYKSTFEYPKGSFGKDLKTIATLIVSGIDTRVYYVSLGGFDNHDHQVPAHDNNLKKFSDAIGIFTDELKANNMLNDVVIMTFSEFGRRVSQNASDGTDHGTANNMFIISGNLKKPGIYNEGPDLVNLDNGDLIYKVDFKDVYGEMLGEWLGADPEKILMRKGTGLGLV